MLPANSPVTFLPLAACLQITLIAAHLNCATAAIQGNVLLLRRVLGGLRIYENNESDVLIRKNIQ